MTKNDSQGSAPHEEPQSALDRTRDTVAEATSSAAQSIQANPLGILVGGLAVGALAGSLLPRSAREKELLAPVGTRIGTTARAAIEAAKEAGRTELETRGFTRDAGREQVKNLLGGIGKALSTGSAAAARTVTGKTNEGE